MNASPWREPTKSLPPAVWESVTEAIAQDPELAASAYRLVQLGYEAGRQGREELLEALRDLLDDEPCEECDVWCDTHNAPTPCFMGTARAVLAKAEVHP